MAGRPNVSIVRTQMVKPAGASAYEGVLQMTAWDQLFGVAHNQTVFLYSPGPEGDWVEKLSGSLGQALAHFSPLAGRLRWVEPERRLLEIVCNGEGAELVEAECEEDISLFRDLTDLKRAVALVPKLDYDLPLEDQPTCVVQLTRFRCGGVALGLSTSHIAADGQSAFHFFSEWARLACGEEIKQAPSLSYRMMFQERESLANNDRQMSDHIEYQNPPLKLGKEDAVEEWKKELVKFALPLTKEQVDVLKAASSNVDGLSREFSRYEVVSSHIWRSLCKARGLEYEQETILAFPVNVRNHIHSIPLPPATFGNMIVSMRAQSQVRELISNDLGFVCKKLREAINMASEDYIWSNFDVLEKQEDLSFFMKDVREESKMPTAGRPYYGNPNLRAVSYLSLPIKNIDFGWGNYVEIIPVARDIDGTTILLPMPGKKDGSIVVLMCLQVVYVEEFKKYFYQDIDKQ